MGSLFVIGFMCAALFMTISVNAATSTTSYYVSPTGSDSNAGTKSKPFKSLMKAQSAAASGDTVYIRGGVYNDFDIAKIDSIYNYVNDITKSGITYKAYAGERPVFEFKNVPTNLRVAAFFVEDQVTGVTFKGFDVTGIEVGDQAQSEAFRIRGQADIVNVAAHDIEAIGFYFTGRGTGTVLNSDAYITLDQLRYPLKIQMVWVLMEGLFRSLNPVHGITVTMDSTVSAQMDQ
ncbi:right-handed parallel beta-helix repeat-containing protein [Paenibacillus algorifonticola]|nr:DUF1565 domain-containing protein [Paenibacillus algorifonticola]